MIKNLRVKFVVTIVLTMTISGLCSIMISAVIFSSKIEGESRESQRIVANRILEIYDNTDFDLDKAIDISVDERHEVEYITDINKYNEKFNEIKDRSLVQFKKEKLPITDTILYIDNKYIKISNLVNERYIHYGTFIIAGTAIIISTIIATIISGVISKRLLKPVRDLTRATEEVSKGNFNIRINPPNDYELRVLTDHFNKMVHELNGIETLRNDFVSNVSHEIKTPLASIQGFAKLVQDNNFSEDERKEFAEIIISESGRLSKLTSNVLKLSKLENQDIITEKVSFSLDEQIRCAILIMEPEWSEKNIELDIELNEVNIIENEDLLQQVWVNLIGNAIKFTKSGGKIGIKLMELDNNIEIIVSDNGIGMNEEIQKHIFEKFYQGDKSHKSNGNGLGLALVKRIIHLCNGKISVKSKVNYGTTFIIELPKK